jgi:hypothetical protein
MTAIGRILQLKRDDRPFRIRLVDGREFRVDSGGSVEIDIAEYGGDYITVFDAIRNREFRIPAVAIARISTPEDFDDQRTWSEKLAELITSLQRCSPFPTLMTILFCWRFPVSRLSCSDTGVQPGTEAHWSIFSSLKSRTSRRRRPRKGGSDSRRLHDLLSWIQVGALETQESRQQPIPFWLVSFSDTVKNALKQLWLCSCCPTGRVVEPRVEERL